MREEIYPQPDIDTNKTGSVQADIVQLRNQLFKINLNRCTYSVITNSIRMSSTDVSEEEENKEQPRTELDSHANMPVVGCNACVISDTGRIADVNPFTPDYKLMQIPIVDAAVRCDCSFTGKKHILVIQNALLKK